MFARIHVSPRALARAALLFASPVLAQDGGTPPPAAPPPDSTVVPETNPAPTPPAPTVAPAPATRVYASDDTTLALPMVLDVRNRRELDAEQQRMNEMKSVALSKVTTQRTFEARRKAQVD